MTNSSLEVAAFKAMLRIRLIEQEIARRYPEGKMRCPTHLSVGQEAPAVAVCSQLTPSDQVVSTHRSHAHYLAKGGNLNRMVAELYGKESGCSSGRGGSMHLVDRQAGFVGSTAIVGNSIPIGVGIGLSLALHGSTAISVVFLGEGSTEEGVFYESINFAVVRKIPVLFVCENNLYSVYSPLGNRQPQGRKISQFVYSLGATAFEAADSSFAEVFKSTDAAVKFVRTNRLPAFLEIPTYRWLEHCGPNDDDALGYRPCGELAEWLAKDPLVLLRAHLFESGKFDPPAEAEAIEEIEQEIREAFAFAESSPFPDPSDHLSEVFADVK